MKTEDVIAMAKAAWAVVEVGLAPVFSSHKELFDFAELVAAKERRLCAVACDKLMHSAIEAQQGDPSELSNVMLRQVAVLGHGECADAIRARSLKGASDDATHN